MLDIDKYFQGSDDRRQQVRRQFETLYDKRLTEDEQLMLLQNVLKELRIYHQDYDDALNKVTRFRIYKEVVGDFDKPERYTKYKEHFKEYIKTCERLAPEMKPDSGLFDLDRLAEALAPSRDKLIDHLGLINLYDRYLIKDTYTHRRLETPQMMWMRVAMGVCYNEINPTEQAIEFYHYISQLKFMPSTPTLFNAGTRRPQLSSCFLTTVHDSIDGIFKGISDNAKMAKWAGGIANDWSRVRSCGAKVVGTNGESQGTIPYLKIVNDTSLAVNQGGKRKGATCVYLADWHADILDFVDLRRVAGDERRRTHDIHTAVWISDAFMRAVEKDDLWYLYDPNAMPELNECYGKEFEKAIYDNCESSVRSIKARELWRLIVSRLYETGHPWICFKDACNRNNTMRKYGMVRSSNLCTEITLVTNDEEVAVCNLGSINLKAFLDGHQLDFDALERAAEVLTRFLDNVMEVATDHSHGDRYGLRRRRVRRRLLRRR